MENRSLIILLVGSGGRESALAWKLAQSRLVRDIFVVPGNGGTAQGLQKVQNVSHVNPDDFPALLAFSRERGVNLVVPGPEAPLVAGIGDFFRAAGIRCFGPTKAAARMEGSKTFSKDFMARHGIPTARYQNFSDYENGRQYLDTVSHSVVIKATGLAAGKGVILPSSKEEAHVGLKDMMLAKEFGSAGDEVVIEEYLEGDEISILSFSDGYTIRSLPCGQDHKQIYDEDKGPNTGGMGCYGPAPIATAQLVEEIHRTVLQPTIDGMRKERMPFVGLLFTGFMLTKNGPKVLEYNVRFGDPETQTLLPLMDADLAEVMVACTEGWLDAVAIRFYPKVAATVVAAAGGYPGPYVRGDTITLGEPLHDTIIFHAGTKGPTISNGHDDGPPALQPLSANGALPHAPHATRHSESLTTSGGRVIAATSTADTLEAAISQAYKGISTIHFDNMHFRRDIGNRGLRDQLASEKLANGGGLTYASAGVSIDSGNSLVKRIKPLVASTARPGASAEIGGFGGAFDLVDAGYTSPPTLIEGTDGVGTKLKIAHAIGKHDTIGIDLVAMTVNDLVVQGAEPLTFMDTYSCSKLDVDIAEQVIRGVCAGCRDAGCALTGGETAEMPGLLEKDSAYDIVGSATGAIERGKPILPDKGAMAAGDILLGLASSGCHSNGFSLIRLIIQTVGLTFFDKAPWGDGETIGESLLTPTRIYVKPLLKVIKKNLVKGIAHITGGGLIDNVPRMLPQHLGAEMNAAAWPVPKVLSWVKVKGKIEHEEFAKTFNTGLGMVMVIGQEHVTESMEELQKAGETVYKVGRVVERVREGCVIRNLDAWD